MVEKKKGTPLGLGRHRSGVIELNRMTAIKVKLDALMSKLGNTKRRMQTALEVGTVDEGER